MGADQTRFSPHILRWLGLAIALAISSTASLALYARGPLAYNNYRIFTHAYRVLVDGGHLSALHPEAHFDVFKYTPTFALAMGLLANLPEWLGLLIWNGLNAGLLVYSLQRLFPAGNHWIAASLIALPAAVTSIQNCQSNSLIAGCLVLTVAQARERAPVRSAIWLTIAGFTKLYSWAALPLGLLSGERRWEFIAAAIGWAIVFLLLPLPMIGFTELVRHYREWLDVLYNDSISQDNLSLLTFIRVTTGRSLPAGPLAGLAALTMLAPLLRPKIRGDQRAPLLGLAATLIWLVIFNPRAESPTFVIAFTGIAIWFAVEIDSFLLHSSGERVSPGAVEWSRARWPVALLIAALIISALGQTDLIPKLVRLQVLGRWVLKPLPCTAIWFWLLHRLWTLPDWSPASAAAAALGSPAAEPAGPHPSGSTDPAAISSITHTV